MLTKGRQTASLTKFFLLLIYVSYPILAFVPRIHLEFICCLCLLWKSGEIHASKAFQISKTVKVLVIYVHLYLNGRVEV